MATDERRRLIYELLVEAVDLKKSTDAATAELKKVNNSATAVAGNIKKAFGALGIAASLKALFSQSQEFQKLNDTIKGIGATFADATLKATGFSAALDDAETNLRLTQGAKDFGTWLGETLVSMDAWARKLTFMDSAWVKWMTTVAKSRLAASQDQAGFDVLSAPGLTQEDMDSIAAGVERAADANKELQEALKSDLATMQHLRDVAKENAEWWREYRFNQAAALKAESRAAARDARANTPQFALDNRQFVADMDTAAKSTEVLRLNTQEIADNMRRMQEDAPAFNEHWHDLAETSYEWADALERAADAMDAMNEVQGSLVNQAVAWGEALTYAFKGVLTGELHNTRDLLRSIVTEMRDFYAEMVAREIAEQALRGIRKIISSFMGGGGAADGKAFAGGHVIPFALGGVVGGPALFNMAGGRTGVMGEAGPEAIMPLRRGADGRLGVSATQPIVNLHNNTGVSMSAKAVGSNERMEITLEAAQMGARMAVADMNRSIRSGYGVTAQSMSRTFGLRRRV